MGGPYSGDEILTAVEKTCRDCGVHFVLSGDQRQFFRDKGLSEPSRCEHCRRNRRLRERYNAEGKPWFEVRCAECGRLTVIPFEPTDDRPIYCRDCYAQRHPERLEKTP